MVTELTVNEAQQLAERVQQEISHWATSAEPDELAELLIMYRDEQSFQSLFECLAGGQTLEELLDGILLADSEGEEEY